MVKQEDPNVYVVDSRATRPHTLPRLGQRQRRAGVAQTLLFLLVSVALCGMTIEACFIYRLYFLEPAASASFSKLTGGEDVTSTTKSPSYDILPSKPVAHLTDGNDVVHGQEIMEWSMIAEPILYDMAYKDGSLIIQKEGYYYVYSKVFFSEGGTFYHSVDMNTQKYPGKSITLQRSRKYPSKKSEQQSNSYLGGVFHLYKDDALLVRVRNTSKIQRHKSYENFFGAFMI
ncbi:tumor necrosis factor ligand superfamily member 14 isoform X1 [Hippoglossus hippoglossus]|uniref:tumor necrosis factor ligand superfamily member 14 isoform X1 n=1 Tax=Hippoglossus hippoglossus TaxID=8267 RepID=UPI00148DCF10|nr:tumor necrosis factor ligand superfamily member 14 isoform X1 [Hippoglossus hippoglossus]